MAGDGGQVTNLVRARDDGRGRTKVLHSGDRRHVVREVAALGVSPTQVVTVAVRNEQADRSCARRPDALVLKADTQADERIVCEEKNGISAHTHCVHEANGEPEVRACGAVHLVLGEPTSLERVLCSAYLMLLIRP